MSCGGLYFVAGAGSAVSRGATRLVAAVLSPSAVGIMFMKTTTVMPLAGMLPAKLL